jgi:hypothetical protein
MDDTLEFDESGLHELARSSEERMAMDSPHSAERDEIRLRELHFKRLTFEKWSQKRQEQWCAGR